MMPTIGRALCQDFHCCGEVTRTALRKIMDEHAAEYRLMASI
jgi:hypothetical protein